MFNDPKDPPLRNTPPVPLPKQDIWDMVKEQGRLELRFRTAVPGLCPSPAGERGREGGRERERETTWISN